MGRWTDGLRCRTGCVSGARRISHHSVFASDVVGNLEGVAFAICEALAACSFATGASALAWPKEATVRPAGTLVPCVHPARPASTPHCDRYGPRYAMHRFSALGKPAEPPNCRQLAGAADARMKEMPGGLVHAYRSVAGRYAGAALAGWLGCEALYNRSVGSDEPAGAAGGPRRQFGPGCASEVTGVTAQCLQGSSAHAMARRIGVGWQSRGRAASDTPADRARVGRRRRIAQARYGLRLVGRRGALPPLSPDNNHIESRNLSPQAIRGDCRHAAVAGQGEAGAVAE